MIEQVARYFTRYICLDSWFHSLDVIEFLSQFSFVIGANGKIVNGENGFYVSRSERKRLVVRGRGGRATNLDLPRDDVFRVYDEVRTPI